MSGEVWYWVILIAANVPLYVGVARIICGGVLEWRGRWWYWVVPDIGMFGGDHDTESGAAGSLFDLFVLDGLAGSSLLSWRFWSWLVVCVVLVWGEHRVIQKG